ncbi:hypothetical protein [Moraxella lincolnii]|uniref:hypothetical protein n=1 Tax=Lwoffella lincolnii TaxID=90241 RepID=UPI0039844A7C
MIVIKATLTSYHNRNSINFYFNTRKSKIKVASLVDAVGKVLPISLDFSKNQYYCKTVVLEDLLHTFVEDSEGKYLMMFDLIQTANI